MNAAKLTKTGIKINVKIFSSVKAYGHVQDSQTLDFATFLSLNGNATSIVVGSVTSVVVAQRHCTSIVVSSVSLSQ